MASKKPAPPRPTLQRGTVLNRPIYSLELEHWTIEELAAGRCPEALAAEAHRLMRWQREAIRAQATTAAIANPRPAEKRRRR